MLTFDNLLFRWLAAIALIIAIVAALFLARAVFLPLALGLLTALVLYLPSTALARAGLPKMLAIAILLAGVVGVLLLIFTLTAGPVGQIIDSYPQILSELRVKLLHFRETISAAEQAGDALSKVAEDVQDMVKDPKVQEVVIREPNFLARAATSLADVVTGLVVTMTITGFVLVVRDPFVTLSTMPFGTRAAKLKAARIWIGVEREVSHYFLVTSIINAGLGITVGSVLWALDVPMPHVWGIAVALLNYILFVGPAIGMMSLLAASIIQFDTAFQIMAPSAAYLTINFIEANAVTPHFLGRRLNVAPLAILLSLLFWGWLWGFGGLIVALPVLVVLKAVADRTLSLQRINRILTPRRPPGKAMEPVRPSHVGSPERSRT